MRSNAHNLLFGATVAIALSGCATQTLPENNTGAELTPPAWKNVASELASSGVNWSSFDDPRLAELIELALAHNPDITTATESLNSSRVGLEEAEAARRVFYTVGADATTSKTRNFDASEFYGLSGIASYEVDIWGRRKDDVTVAQLNTISAESGLLGIRISLAAEVADSYYTLRVQDEHLKLKARALQYVLKQQSQVVARHDAGIVTGVEIDRQEVEVLRLRSEIENLKGQRSLQEDRLATLTGRAPQQFQLVSIDSVGLPAVYLAPDLPAEVLRVRPDIRSAEAGLESSIVRFDQAKKAFYPTISLTGSGGFASPSLGDLITDASSTYTVGAGVLTTLLDNGARRRNVERARIAAAQQVASYRRTILAALREVESALNQQEVSLRQLRIQELQLASQERVTREAEARYKQGSISGFELITQQRSLLLQHEQILSTQLSGIQATVQLFRAVGIAP